MRRGVVWGAALACDDWGGGGGPAGGGIGAAQKEKAPEIYLPISGFDLTSIDKTVNPCNDFYKFACGKFTANHPIPADQPSVNTFYSLFNVNTQSLRGILEKAAAGGAGGRRMSRRLATTTTRAWIRARSRRRGWRRCSRCWMRSTAWAMGRRASRSWRRCSASCSGWAWMRSSVWRAAGLQGCEQADCHDWAGRTGLAGAGLLPAHRREGCEAARAVCGSCGEDADAGWQYSGAGGEGCARHDGDGDGAGEGVAGCDDDARSGEDLSSAADCDVYGELAGDELYGV